MDVANPQDLQFVSRFALTTSTGSFQMWQQDKLLWTREESLATIRASMLVDLPVQPFMAQKGKVLQSKVRVIAAAMPCFELIFFRSLAF